MKKRVTYFLLITVVLIFSAKLIYAEGQVSTVLPTATPAVTVTPTTAVTSTPAPTDPLEPTPTVKPLEIPGITDNALYKDLLSKKENLNTLGAEENQVCKDINDQEKSNGQAVLRVKEKSESYCAPYLRVIDEIKSLLNPIKEKRVLNLIELNKNTKAPTATPKVESNDTVDTGNGNENSGYTLDREIEISTSHISGLNQAIKGMRTAIKFISFESIEYNKKIKTAQQQINKINDDIDILNKKIIDDKLVKDNEWESFCTAMYNKDLKAADTSYGKIVETKKRIVNNYKEILKLKRDIENLLLSLE